MRFWPLFLVLGALTSACGQMASQADLAPSLAAVSTDPSYCRSRYNFENPTTAFVGVSTQESWAPAASNKFLDATVAYCGARSMRVDLDFNSTKTVGVIQAVFPQSIDARDATHAFSVRLDPAPPPELSVRFVFIDQRQEWVGTFATFAALRPGWNRLEKSTARQDNTAATAVGFIVQILYSGGNYAGKLWIDEITY